MTADLMCDYCGETGHDYRVHPQARAQAEEYSGHNDWADRFAGGAYPDIEVRGTAE